MLFPPVAALLAPLLFAQGAIAALTGPQVVTNIGIVTTVSGDLNDALGLLTTKSDPATVKNIAVVSSVNLPHMIRTLTGLQLHSASFRRFPNHCFESRGRCHRNVGHPPTG